MGHPENLRSLYANPSLLIPQRLLEIKGQGSEIAAIPFEVELGRLDQEYTPELAVIIFERDGFSKNSKEQEETDKWDKVLEHQRQIALKRKALGGKDRPLLSVIATEYHPTGVEVLGYIQATSLRKRQIGKAFFGHFESLLWQMGYKHLWGSHSPENIGFFLKIGRFTVDQLIPTALTKNGLSPIPYYDLSPGIAAIKFLDKEMEKECVKPEFLGL